MNDINKAIKKHEENSKMLRKIYMGDKNLSYEKSSELQELQEKEWQKINFLKNIQKELRKKKGN